MLYWRPVVEIQGSVIATPDKGPFVITIVATNKNNTSSPRIVTLCLRREKSHCQRFMYAFFNIQKEHLNTHKMCKSIICYTAKIIRISRMIEMFVNLDNEFLKLKSNTKRKLILIHFLKRKHKTFCNIYC